MSGTTGPDPMQNFIGPDHLPWFDQQEDFKAKRAKVRAAAIAAYQAQADAKGAAE